MFELVSPLKGNPVSRHILPPGAAISEQYNDMLQSEGRTFGAALTLVPWLMDPLAGRAAVVLHTANAAHAPQAVQAAGSTCVQRALVQQPAERVPDLLKFNPC